MSNAAKSTDLTVANTILAQLGGGRRLSAMIGAKDFVGASDALTFKFKARARNGATCCRVTLDSDDTYTVTWYRLRGRFDVTELSSSSMVYADSLPGVFEAATGLLLSL